MKKYLILLFIVYASIAKSQTDVPLNVPGIGHGATVNDPTYRFSFSGFPVGHYGLGWYAEGGGSPFGYLSGYAGLRFFTLGTPRMNINTNGNVGIGEPSPVSLLTLKRMDPYGDHITILRGDNTGNLDVYSVYNGSSDVQTGSFGYGVNPLNDAWQIWEKGLNPSWANLFTVKKDGNVGIGTATPREKLSVNGNIRAKEVKVETKDWPDYVFKKDYKMISLPELKEFIRINEHLPEMPKAVDAEINGVELGQLNKLLLKKVEELTLLLINQYENAEIQGEKLKQLSSEMKALKETIRK